MIKTCIEWYNFNLIYILLVTYVLKEILNFLNFLNLYRPLAFIHENSAAALYYSIDR